MKFFNDPPLTDIIRAILALGLAGSLPFVVYYGAPDTGVAVTYQDAVAAVIAFYFGATTSQQP